MCAPNGSTLLLCVKYYQQRCGVMGKDIATKFKLILLWFSVRAKLLQLQC